MKKKSENIRLGMDIAVIGMSGRFPGAKNVDEYWNNLISGVESIYFFTDEELLEAGVKPEQVHNPRYVKGKGVLKDFAYFDAKFFDYSPREAKIMDPQTRIFHECVWEALENAGYNVDTYSGLIGLYAGASPNVPWEVMTFKSEVTDGLLDNFTVALRNNKDLMNTQISYNMNLRGPSISLYSACSTSLVAIHEACQGLLSGDCDIALSGGVCVELPHTSGYLYEEGMIKSSDGHCRAFDGNADGTVYGSGAGVVVLKRIEDAIADKDTVLAIIKGSAINNDGKRKVGYTAPSVDGQAEVIQAAMQIAEVTPDDMCYIETHGTGTNLGDAIEIEGLKTAFAESSGKSFCGIGSVKPNIGHLDAAAGVASFIKAVLILKNRWIPPHLHYQTPNTKIDFVDSPFYVNKEASPLNEGTCNYIGVSSFGLGGGNCHIVLQDGVVRRNELGEKGWNSLSFSAKSKTALEKTLAQYEHYLSENKEIRLTDVAYTLHFGRKVFPYRGTVVCNSVEDAIVKIEALKKKPAAVAHTDRIECVWLLSDQNTSYDGFGYGLYQCEKEYKNTVLQGMAVLNELLPFELTVKDIFYGNKEISCELARKIKQASFLIRQNAVAKVLLNWGVHPSYMIEQGLGNYSAAIIDGKLSLKEAIQQVFKLKEIKDSVSDEFEDRISQEAKSQIEELTGRSNTVFLELGAASKLSEITAGYICKENRLLTIRNQALDNDREEPHLLEVLASLWEMGVSIDWDNYYENAKHNRVALPTYPFERKYFWIEMDPLKELTRNDTVSSHNEHTKNELKKNVFEEWFYRPVWEQSFLKVQSKRGMKKEKCLMFASECEMGKKLVKNMKEDRHDVIEVYAGSSYCREGEKCFVINPSKEADYIQLLEDIAKTGEIPLTIVHFWLFGMKDNQKDFLNEGFYSLMFLSKAISAKGIFQKLKINVISRDMHLITGKETIIPEKMLSLAVVKVLPQEYQSISCHCIDVSEAEETEKAKVVWNLSNEIWNNSEDQIVAYRENNRLVKAYQRISKSELVANNNQMQEGRIPKLRQNGVYLITGGLGEIGMILAHYLAKTVKARLILISRSEFPDRENWSRYLEEENSEKNKKRISKVMELEKAGAVVFLAKADVSSEEQMQNVIEIAEEKFGEINGILHAAGIIRVKSGQTPIEKITREDCEEQFLPKLYGTQVLQKVLKNKKIDFCMMISSLAPVLGGLGHVAYAAANLYMDALVEKMGANNTGNWICVNWAEWKTAFKAEQKYHVGESLEKLELEPQEGVRVFEHILQMDGIHRIIISTGDLQSRIDQWIKINAEEKSTTGSGKYLNHYENMSQASGIETILTDIWKQYYDVKSVSLTDNFFEMGATSLDFIHLNSKLGQTLERHIPLEALFEYPTIKSLASYLAVGEDEEQHTSQIQEVPYLLQQNRDVAIIGIAGQYPNAKNIEEYWQNLLEGKEGITFFEENELLEYSAEKDLIHDSNFVKAKGYLPNAEYFDENFFHYSASDAELLDPQIRVFMECVWEVLEDGGYNPDTFQGAIGLFAGATPNLYWEVMAQLSRSHDSAGQFESSQLYDKDALTTQIAYKLNLKGPSNTIFTGCSTSLVAVDLACQSLLSGQCEMAVAGGVTITLPLKSGYKYQEGMIFSSDGHIRSFDEKADGIVFSDGAGAVLLKPYQAAVQDGDNIYAVIKGSAVNNDGNRKVGYTSPSVRGQAEVIRRAQKIAGIKSESVSYIETHGTATRLGDPIEIKALIKAFYTEKKGFCRIGSVKSNIGHTMCASGVAGLIKATLSLKNKVIPPSLNYETANSEIDFENSPFVVNTQLTKWERANEPLIAGVSSFGIGGTNAHIVVEEAPEIVSSRRKRHWKLLLLSARSESALDKMTENLTCFLEKNSDCKLEDIAYTLQVGRKKFNHCRMLVCDETFDAIECLTKKSKRVKTVCMKENKRALVYLFPGQGSQYVNMGEELYRMETVFREAIDQCAKILNSLIAYDIRDIMYPKDEKMEEAKREINKTEVTQPILFVFEYALAKLMMSWGLQPSAMIGYSFGEYVVAQLAGVLSLEDVLKLIVCRGKLMQTLPEGAMLSVPLTENEIKPLLEEYSYGLENRETLSLGIINGPSCIISGSKRAVSGFESYLKERRHFSFPVAISYGVHSAEMEPIAEEIRTIISRMKLEKPTIPYISGLTGTWIREEQATDPEYWVRHLKECMHFSDGIKMLLEEPNTIFIEVGPGRDLSVLLNRFLEKEPGRIVNLIRHSESHDSDLYFLMTKVAHMWAHGIEIDWSEFYRDEKRKRISLPKYPFERNHYWIEGNPYHLIESQGIKENRNKKPNIKNWFYRVQWKQADFVSIAREEEKLTWLLFMDQCSIAMELAELLKSRGHRVLMVTQGAAYTNNGEGEFTIDWREEVHYIRLVKELIDKKRVPDKIVHCFGIMQEEKEENREDFGDTQDRTFYSILKLVKALGNENFVKGIQINVVTNNMHDITGEEKLNSGKSTILGAITVIPQEYPLLQTRSLDVVVTENHKKLARQLWNELCSEAIDNLVAFRGGHRWIKTYDELEWRQESDRSFVLKEESVYLITGGLGGIGFLLSKHLAQTYHAKLILTGRTEIPPREAWDEWLLQHGEKDSIREKIEMIQLLETLGAKIITCQADVSDEESMKKAIVSGEAVFGPIKGVIHCAGILDGKSFNILRDIQKSDCELQFDAKVYGLMVLEKLLKNKQLDFCMVMSSISAILGGLGFVAYAAANNYMDHFVIKHNKENEDSWFSVNWSEWKYKKKVTLGFGDSISEYGMDSSEAVEAFERILNTKLNGQVANSPGSLNARMEEWVFSKNKETIEENEETDLENFHDRSLNLTSDYVAPKNDLERKLAEIWGILFRVKDIGVEDDFFELGGDSLKSITVVTRIHKELNVEIPVTEFFQNATVEKIALFINKAVMSSYKAIQPVAKRQYYPVSPAQKSIYIIRQLEGEQTSYNTPVAIIIEGNLNKNKLEGSFRKLMERHESLRTSFRFINGELVQYIHDNVKFKLEYSDISKDASKQDQDALKEIVKAFIRPFDLDRAPLIRGKLVKIAKDKHILMYDLHHIISDGVSANIVVEELIKVYSDKELTELKLQYRDFSEWQNQLYQSEAFQKQENYWLQKLSGEIPLLNMPTDFTRPLSRCFDGESVTFEVNEELMTKLNELASENKTTLYTVLLAVYNILLSKYTGQQDILVGLSTAGRLSVELENIIGMFVNTVVMRNHPYGNLTFLQFLNEVKTTAFEAYENQDYPFDGLVEKLQIDRDPGRSPVFDTMFTLQNLEIGETDVDGLKVIPFDFETSIAKFDLNMNAWEINGKIQFVMEYASTLFKRETIESMCNRYTEIMKEVVDNWEIEISQIESISEDKMNLLLDFNEDLENE